MTDGVVQHAMARSLLSWSIDVQFYHDAIANQIVSLAGICEVPIFAINRELGTHRHLIRSDLNRRGKGNRLLYTMEVEIACDVVVGTCRFDLYRGECCLGKLRDVKEI